MLTSIAALFTIAEKRKQLQCLLTGKWLQKVWHIFYTAGCYSAIKMNKLLIYATTKVNLKNMLSEISQP